MKSSPMEMFEPSNNKENIVLRSLVGDPNRHVPLADHSPASIYSNEDKQPASLYTLETRYQPIPSKVLPKANDPRVYYIDSVRREETPIMTERMSHRQTPVPAQSEPATVFLEPKIISQPILYSIIDAKYAPPIPPEERTMAKKPPVDNPPTLYALNDRPRRPTMDIEDTKSPAMYSVLGSPRLPYANEQPINQYPQHAPHLYSITGNSVRASRGVQVNTLDPDQPAPVLYTIVGDTPKRTERSHDKPLPSNTEPAPYTIITEKTTPRVNQQPSSTTKPSMYTLVGQPNSSYNEDYTRSSPRKRTPPPPVTTNSTTRSTTRSFERKPETVREDVISYPVIERKQPAFPRELKPESMYIPPEERRTRPPPPPSQSNPKPYIVSQTQPLPITSYRTYKPYRERNPDNTTLPIVTHTHPNRKPRPALYEPRYQPDKHHPYIPVKHTSSERYPVNPRSNLWNYGGYQSDDEEMYDQRTPKKKRIYKPVRARVPWIPVW